MAAPLTNNNPPRTTQGAYHLVVIQAGDFAHIASSTTSALGWKSESSSTGSRYNFRASLRVSPSLMQPGRDGTIAVKPPSSLFSNTTLSFIDSPLYITARKKGF